MLRRLLRALQALIFGHVSSRLGSLILVPIFLSRWTASVYGEYLALFAFVSYLSGLDLGVQLAAVNRLTADYTSQDFEDYRRCQSSASALYLSLACLTFLLLCILTWLLPIPQWIGLKHTPPRVARGVIIILGAYVLGCLPQRLVTSIYQTVGDLARAQWIQNLQQVGILGASIVLLLCGRGMISMALAQIAILSLGCLYVLWDRNKRFPELTLTLDGAQLRILRQLFEPSLLFAALMIGNLVAFQGQLLIVSARLGGAAVAILSVSRTLVTTAREALYSVSVSLWPDLARMMALKRFEQIRTVHRLSVFATGALGIAAATTVWFEGREIISLWTGGRLQPSEFLIRAFAVYLALQTPWAASSAVTTATNRHRTYAICYFLATIVSVITTAVLVRGIGTPAVPMGLMLGEAICCYHFVVRDTCKEIHEDYRRFALRLWLGLLIIAAATFMVGLFLHLAVSGSVVLQSALVALASLFTSLACAALVWLRSRERDELLRSARSLLPQKYVRAPAATVSLNS